MPAIATSPEARTRSHTIGLPDLRGNRKKSQKGTGSGSLLRKAVGELLLQSRQHWRRYRVSHANSIRGQPQHAIGIDAQLTGLMVGKRHKALINGPATTVHVRMYQTLRRHLQ